MYVHASVNVDQYDGLHPCPKRSSPLVGKELICKLKEMERKKKQQQKETKQHEWGKVRQLKINWKLN